MKAFVVGLFVWAVATGAWAQQPSDKLGVGDALRITVFQQPDLTTETRITDRGTVNMPLIGEIKVSGMSAQQASIPLAGSHFKFAQHGQSGAWVSELLPHTAGIADKLSPNIEARAAPPIPEAPVLKKWRRVMEEKAENSEL